MISLSSIQDAFFDWVNENTTVGTNNIIWSFQNVPVPEQTDPYITLRILTLSQIGDADFKTPEAPINEGDKDMIITLDGMLEIQGFNFGVMQQLIDLKRSINIPSVHQTLRDSDIITWNMPSPISDISGLDDVENEERALYEQEFRVNDIESNIDLGSIVIVNANGTYEQPGKPDITTILNIDAS